GPAWCRAPAAAADRAIGAGEPRARRGGDAREAAVLRPGAVPRPGRQRRQPRERGGVGRPEPQPRAALAGHLTDERAPSEHPLEIAGQLVGGEADGGRRLLRKPDGAARETGEVHQRAAATLRDRAASRRCSTIESPT